jgi:hypothetical protein
LCRIEVDNPQLPKNWSPKEITVKPGDYVKVIGRDGFYVFLKEVKGMATLREGSERRPETPTFAIAMSQIISLEKGE